MQRRVRHCGQSARPVNNLVRALLLPVHPHSPRGLAPGHGKCFLELHGGLNQEGAMLIVATKDLPLDYCEVRRAA